MVSRISGIIREMPQNHHTFAMFDPPPHKEVMKNDHCSTGLVLWSLFMMRGWCALDRSEKFYILEGDATITPGKVLEVQTSYQLCSAQWISASKYTKS